MMKKRMTALSALLLAAVLGLAGCSSSNSSGSAANGSASASSNASSGGGAGFEEIPIGDDNEVFPLNIGVVYFQPIDMEPAGMGLTAAESNLHLEADIHALANNNLGYGTGEYIPDLTVDYKIQDKNDSSNVVEGTFMQMNASDGPHYGANLKLDKAGSYTATLTIHSPEEKGWMLHVDPETGVTGRFWTSAIVDTRDWDYTPQQW